MKTLLRSVLALAIVLALAATVAALLLWQMPPLHGTISIDGESVAIHGLGGLDELDGGHAALGVAIGAAAVAGAVLVAIAAVLIGLAAASVGIATALVAVAGSLILAASPLLLIALVVWWVVRRRPARPSAAGVMEASA